MKITLAQLNQTIGSFDCIRDSILWAIDEARSQGSDLVVFPELAVCGYPPRDLLLVEGFVQKCAQTAKEIGEHHTDGIAMILGTPLPVQGGIANSLVVYQNGELLGYHDKRLLPTYDVFDEDRYFEPGHKARVIEIAGEKIGLAICEDLWRGSDAGFSSKYDDEPDHVAELVTHGATIIVAPSASPFVLGKDDKHQSILRGHATRFKIPVVSVNQVGGNDDLVFAGNSSIIAPDGSTIARCKSFDEDLQTIDLDTAQPIEVRAPASERQLVDALTLGVRDYVQKCGFSRACIGLSGGIDSAIVATIAVRALGADNVIGASMPGVFSSEGSKSDAFDLAKNLGIRCISLPIMDGFDALSGTLNNGFAELNQSALGETLPDITQENLQSRIRGTMMMALSNRTGALVLTTGNKSELAVGYCTLYGDMNGGLAVIADLPKTMVFRACRYLNEHAAELGYPCPPIPENTITKPPSAELAPGQLDSDSLPPYEILDEIVERHIEKLQSAATIIEQTRFNPETVRRICRLIDRNEYKRQQMAVGLKVTSVAFGAGRRMPIAQRFTR
ncbi:MAG: NAD+ synthase [Phycisphaerales bacterium]|nr:NAD+ synthase [Phycisphaerales bacterium]